MAALRLLLLVICIGLSESFQSVAKIGVCAGPRACGSRLELLSLLRMSESDRPRRTHKKKTLPVPSSQQQQPKIAPIEPSLPQGMWAQPLPFTPVPDAHSAPVVRHLTSPQLSPLADPSSDFFAGEGMLGEGAFQDLQEAQWELRRRQTEEDVQWHELGCVDSVRLPAPLPVRLDMRQGLESTATIQEMGCVGALQLAPPKQRLQWQLRRPLRWGLWGRADTRQQPPTVQLKTFGSAAWEEMGLASALRVAQQRVKKQIMDLHATEALKMHWHEMGLVKSVMLKMPENDLL